MFITLLAGAGCAPDPAPSSGAWEVSAPFIAAPPLTSRDSLLAVRQLARFIAIGAGDSIVRLGLRRLARAPSVSAREFFRTEGLGLARRIEAANHLEPGDFERALSFLPELQFTLAGTSSDELLVTARLDGGSPWSCAGDGAIGYDQRGWERSTCAGTVQAGLVLILRPAGINPAPASS